MERLGERERRVERGEFGGPKSRKKEKAVEIYELTYRGTKTKKKNEIPETKMESFIRRAWARRVSTTAESLRRKRWRVQEIEEGQ